MPYIRHADKCDIGCDYPPWSVGTLNYAITDLCVKYLERNTLSYEHLNAVVGVLECAKQEFYRRMAVPYEEKKKEENGDVYY